MHWCNGGTGIIVQKLYISVYKKAYLKRDFTIAVNSQIPAEKPGFFRALTYKGIYELADFTIN